MVIWPWSGNHTKNYFQTIFFFAQSKIQIESIPLMRRPVVSWAAPWLSWWSCGPALSLPERPGWTLKFPQTSSLGQVSRILETISREAVGRWGDQYPSSKPQAISLRYRHSKFGDCRTEYLVALMLSWKSTTPHFPSHPELADVELYNMGDTTRRKSNSSNVIHLTGRFVF